MPGVSCNANNMIFNKKNGEIYTNGYKLNCTALSDNNPIVSSKTDMNLALPLLLPAFNSHLDLDSVPPLISNNENIIELKVSSMRV